MLSLVCFMQAILFLFFSAMLFEEILGQDDEMMDGGDASGDDSEEVSDDSDSDGDTDESSDESDDDSDEESDDSSDM